MMKKRRWLLPVLLMIILVPVLSALIFSTRGLYAQRDAMVKMAERYSQTLARGIVRDESGSSTETPLQRHRRMGLFLKMLTVGPPRARLDRYRRPERHQDPGIARQPHHTRTGR